MNLFLTASPPELIQKTILALQSHGHTIMGAPQGPCTDVSLLRTQPQLGPQLVASVGATPSGWLVILSETP
jgi:hypothetical protein